MPAASFRAQHWLLPENIRKDILSAERATSDAEVLAIPTSQSLHHPNLIDGVPETYWHVFALGVLRSAHTIPPSSFEEEWRKEAATLASNAGIERSGDEVAGAAGPLDPYYFRGLPRSGFSSREQCAALGESDMGLLAASRLISTCLTQIRFKLSDDAAFPLVEALYAHVCDPALLLRDPDAWSTVASALQSLTSGDSDRPTSSKFSLPWRPFFTMVNCVTAASTRRSIDPRHSAVQSTFCTALRDLLSALRRWFPSSAVREVWAQTLPFLTPRVPQSVTYLALFIGFFPTRVDDEDVPAVRDIVSFLVAARNWNDSTAMWMFCLLWFFRRVACALQHRMDWSPHCDAIFQLLLNSFRLPIGSSHEMRASLALSGCKMLGDLTKLDTESMGWQAAIAVVFMLPADHEAPVWRQLRLFATAVSSYLRPGARVTAGVSGVAMLLKNITHEYARRWARQRKPKNVPYHPSFFLTQQCDQTLCDIIFPLCIDNIFANNRLVAPAIWTLSSLSSVTPERTFEPLARRIQLGLTTSTETHQIAVSLEALASAVPSFARCVELRPQLLALLTELPETLLLCIDANDGSKSLLALKLVYQLVTVFPLNSQWFAAESDFVPRLVAAVAVYVEATSSHGGLVAMVLSSAMLAIFSNCNADTAAVCLARIKSLCMSRVAPAASVSVVGALVGALVTAHPTTAAPPLIASFAARLTHAMCRADEVLWFGKLLATVVERCNAETVATQLPVLVTVIDALLPFSFRSTVRRAKIGAKLARCVLRSLTLPVPRDFGRLNPAHRIGADDEDAGESRGVPVPSLYHVRDVILEWSTPTDSTTAEATELWDRLASAAVDEMRTADAHAAAAVEGQLKAGKAAASAGGDAESEAISSALVRKLAVLKLRYLASGIAPTMAAIQIADAAGVAATATESPSLLTAEVAKATIRSDDVDESAHGMQKPTHYNSLAWWNPVPVARWPTGLPTNRKRAVTFSDVHRLLCETIDPLADNLDVKTVTMACKLWKVLWCAKGNVPTKHLEALGEWSSAPFSPDGKQQRLRLAHSVQYMLWQRISIARCVRALATEVDATADIAVGLSQNSFSKIRAAGQELFDSVHGLVTPTQARYPIVRRCVDTLEALVTTVQVSSVDHQVTGLLHLLGLRDVFPLILRSASLYRRLVLLLLQLPQLQRATNEDRRQRLLVACGSHNPVTRLVPEDLRASIAALLSQAISPVTLPDPNKDADHKEDKAAGEGASAAAATPAEAAKHGAATAATTNAVHAARALPLVNLLFNCYMPLVESFPVDLFPPLLHMCCDSLSTVSSQAMCAVATVLVGCGVRHRRRVVPTENLTPSERFAAIALDNTPALNQIALPATLCVVDRDRSAVQSRSQAVLTLVLHVERICLTDAWMRRFCKASITEQRSSGRRTQFFKGIALAVGPEKAVPVLLRHAVRLLAETRASQSKESRLGEHALACDLLTAAFRSIKRVQSAPGTQPTAESRTEEEEAAALTDTPRVPNGCERVEMLHFLLAIVDFVSLHVPAEAAGLWRSALRKSCMRLWSPGELGVLQEGLLSRASTHAKNSGPMAAHKSLKFVIAFTQALQMQPAIIRGLLPSLLAWASATAGVLLSQRAAQIRASFFGLVSACVQGALAATADAPTTLARTYHHPIELVLPEAVLPFVPCSPLENSLAPPLAKMAGRVRSAEDTADDERRRRARQEEESCALSVLMRTMSAFHAIPTTPISSQGHDGGFSAAAARAMEEAEVEREVIGEPGNAKEEDGAKPQQLAGSEDRKLCAAKSFLAIVWTAAEPSVFAFHDPEVLAAMLLTFAAVLDLQLPKDTDDAVASAIRIFGFAKLPRDCVLCAIDVLRRILKDEVTSVGELRRTKISLLPLLRILFFINSPVLLSSPAIAAAGSPATFDAQAAVFDAAMYCLGHSDRRVRAEAEVLLAVTVRLCQPQQLATFVKNALATLGTVEIAQRRTTPERRHPPAAAVGSGAAVPIAAPAQDTTQSAQESDPRASPLPAQTERTPMMRNSNSDSRGHGSVACTNNVVATSVFAFQGPGLFTPEVSSMPSPLESPAMASLRVLGAMTPPPAFGVPSPSGGGGVSLAPMPLLLSSLPLPPAEVPPLRRARVEPNQRLAAATALCAVLSAFPDTVPSYAPTVMKRLSRFVRDRSPDISSVVREMFQSWWRAHRDRWQFEHKEKFSEALADELAELFQSPSYYV